MRKFCIQRGFTRAFAQGRGAMIPLFLAFLATTAGFGQSDSRDDLVAYRNYISEYFKKYETNNNLPSFGQYAYAPVKYRAPQSKGSYNKLNQFPKGDSQNYVKSQMIQQIGTLAQALAQTAGTAMAFDSANQLNNQAAQFKATGDPTLTTIAGQLATEATAVQNGDQAGAQSAANQISATPLPYVSPNYTPGPQESQFVQALQNVIGMIITSVTGVLGVALVSKFLAALGLGGGSGGALGSILGGGAAAVVQGQPPAQAANNTGASAAYSAGGIASSSVNLGVNNAVNPKNSVSVAPQNGQNTGGMPNP